MKCSYALSVAQRNTCSTRQPSLWARTPADAAASDLFKQNVAKTHLPPEAVGAAPRLTCCMKKMLLLSAVLLGAASASQAGVQVSIGIGIPLPGVVIAQPALVVVAPPVVCAPPPRVVVTRPFVVAPAPVYYGCRPGWRGYPGPRHYHGWHHRW